MGRQQTVRWGDEIVAYEKYKKIGPHIRWRVHADNIGSGALHYAMHPFPVSFRHASVPARNAAQGCSTVACRAHRTVSTGIIRPKKRSARRFKEIYYR